LQTIIISRCFKICALKSITEIEIIEHCKNLFARFGISKVVRSDCGTQFSTEFKKFANKYEFRYVTSSPKFSQSNDAAEAAVKTAKSIIKKCRDIYLGLLAYRTSPLENGFSLAELMFSCKIRSRVPILPQKLDSFREHKRVHRKKQRGRRSKRKCITNVIE